MHKVVSRKGANRNEECNTLLGDPELSCEFFHKAGKLSKHVAATPSLKVSLSPHPRRASSATGVT